MENLNKKAVASAIKCSRPTTAEVDQALTALATGAVEFETSEAGVSHLMLMHFGFEFNNAGEVTKRGFAFYEMVGDAIEKATDPEGKSVRHFRDVYYLGLHTAKREKAKRANPSISDKDLKKVKYPNPSTKFDRIKSLAKQAVEGNLVLGTPKQLSPRDRALRDSHPRWAEYAKMETLTTQDKKIMDALAAVIRACGHDPQKVDLKALGLKK